jgi:acyl dehydratase
MAARSIPVHEIKTFAGKEVGVSDWHLVTQKEVNLFADATHDHQWIHVDPQRAARESPFGGPVAHGYYTLSLAPHLLAQAVVVTGIRMGVNYGADKIRFPAPLKIGASVRAKVALVSADDVPGGVQALWRITWEVKDEAKPACVADVIYRYYV